MGYKYSREELLKAAAELAASSGIGSLTFGAVGASLGISDRTVVYYFPTKNDMITSVIAALGEQLQSALADAFGEVTVAEVAVREAQRAQAPMFHI